MQYRGFKLDQFQIEAIEHINNNKNVIVSAGTGTGKTLIADYLIDICIQNNKRVIYTSPIKALSNQKFKDFKSLYGDKIGLLTGDVSINASAQILIMTTEIYRNMLLSKDPICETIAYVIFDEIHYINDIERGTVWEESIIFSLENTKILALSATIPNADELCDWISTLRNEKVELVYYDYRAVPLEHLFYEHFSGLMTRKEMPKKITELKSYHREPSKRNKKGKRKKVFLHSQDISKNQYIGLVKELKHKEWLPCIFFSFSRKSCEIKAEELAKKFDFLNSDERSYIVKQFSIYFNNELSKLKSIQLIKTCLMKGIGIHHAGLLPAAKEIVETLFAEGIIKILFATETFAVGINMPARSVCFSSLNKYDGINFRNLNTKEYFQMAGRAGRRGIDKQGYSIVLLEPDFDDIQKLISVTEKDTDPIISQYTLSFNTTINLLKYYNEKDIEKILKSNFNVFVRRRKELQPRVMATYKNQLKKLKKMNYIDENNKILEKGNFMSYIYSDEILTTELVFSGILNNLSSEQINIVIASIIYEQRQSDYFSFKGSEKEYNQLLKIISRNEIVEKGINKLSLKRMINVVDKWSKGCEFIELMDYSNMLEGDYIRLFRQIIDRIQQIIKAGVDYELEQKLIKCISLVDRSVVKVEF
jgi:superfamily II RNA helicase